MQELLIACNTELKPLIYVEKGDNKIGIFAPEIGVYQVVAFSFAASHAMNLVDESFDTLPDAIDRLRNFLFDEYAGR